MANVLLNLIEGNQIISFVSSGWHIVYILVSWCYKNSIEKYYDKKL